MSRKPWRRQASESQEWNPVPRVVAQDSIPVDRLESTISEVLAGKRKLNRSRIGQLTRYFHVEPGAFMSGPGKVSAIDRVSAGNKHRASPLARTADAVLPNRWVRLANVK
jgi:hypothetical protein